MGQQPIESLSVKITADFSDFAGDMQKRLEKAGPTLYQQALKIFEGLQRAAVEGSKSAVQSLNLIGVEMGKLLKPGMDAAQRQDAFTQSVYNAVQAAAQMREELVKAYETAQQKYAEWNAARLAGDSQAKEMQERQMYLMQQAKVPRGDEDAYMKAYIKSMQDAEAATIKAAEVKAAAAAQAEQDAQKAIEDAKKLADAEAQQKAAIDAVADASKKTADVQVDAAQKATEALKPQYATLEGIIEASRQLAAQQAQGLAPGEARPSSPMEALLAQYISAGSEKAKNAIVAQMAELVPLMNEQGQIIGTKFGQGIEAGAVPATQKAAQQVQKTLATAQATVQANAKGLGQAFGTLVQAPSIANLKAVVTSFQALSKSMAAYKTAAAAAGGAGGAGGSLATVGTTATAAAGGVGTLTAAAIAGGVALAGLGAAAVVAFNSIKAAIPAGMELLESQTRLAQGVRAYQQDIGKAAGTQREWLEFVERTRHEMQVFTQTSLTEATSQAVLFGQSMNFTKKQIQDMVEVSSQLAVVEGTDVNAAFAKVRQALAFQSRYTGLGALGVALSRSRVEAEAFADGVKIGTTEMSAQQKASYTLRALIDAMGYAYEDLGITLDSLPARLKAVEAEMETAQANMGKKVAAIAIQWQTLTLGIKTWWYDLISDAMKGLARIASFMGFVFRLDNQSIDDAWQKHLDRLKQIEEQFAASSITADKYATASEVAAHKSDAAFEEAVRIIEKLTDALEGAADAAVDYGNRSAQAAQDSADRINEIWDKFRTDDTAADADFHANLDEINADYWDSVADRQADFAREIADLDADYYRSRGEEAADFQKDQMRAEEDYQRDIAALTDKYLEDLDEAFIARDARAVIRLTKQYRRELTQKQDAENLRKKRDAEDYAIQLARDEQAWQRRRAEMAEALGRELAELDKAWRKRLDEEARRYAEEKTKLAKERDDQIKAEQEAAKKKQDDLDEDIAKRFGKLLAQWVHEGKMTEEQANELWKIFKDHFGLPAGKDWLVMKTFFDEMEKYKFIDLYVTTHFVTVGTQAQAQGVSAETCPAGFQWNPSTKRCEHREQEQVPTPRDPCAGMGACPNGGYRNPDNNCQCEGGIVPEAAPSCGADEFWDGFSCRKLSEVLGVAITEAGSPNTYATRAVSEAAATVEKQVTLTFDKPLRIEGPAVTDSQADQMADAIMKNLATIIREESERA